jgi:hypothetical protein
VFGVSEERVARLNDRLCEVEIKLARYPNYLEFEFTRKDIREARNLVFDLQQRVQQLEEAQKNLTKDKVLNIFDEFTSAHADEPDVQNARKLIEHATFNEVTEDE